MDAWPEPVVPILPGRGGTLHLFDTAAGEIRPTSPAGHARMYVCGITPYDATHLGHAATYLAFDLVQRVWRDAGHQVHYVQNVTDVDDPLLERAGQTGQSWIELAQREVELFRQDMTALRVLAPDQYLGAVESVPEITKRSRRCLSRARPTDSATTSISTWRALGASVASRTTTTRACSLFSASEGAIRTISASVTPSILCCGEATVTVSRSGTPRSARAVRAGTSNVR